MGHLAAYTGTVRSKLWHSSGPFKMFAHCPRVISHQKEINRKRTSQVVSTYIPWKSIQGINKPSPVCEVVLGCEICQVFQAVQRHCGYYVDGNYITAELADFLNSQKISEQRAVCTSCQTLPFSSLSFPKMFWGPGGSFIPQAEYPSIVYNQRQALHTQWAIWRILDGTLAQSVWLKDTEPGGVGTSRGACSQELISNASVTWQVFTNKLSPLALNDAQDQQMCACNSSSQYSFIVGTHLQWWLGWWAEGVWSVGHVVCLASVKQPPAEMGQTPQGHPGRF